MNAELNRSAAAACAMLLALLAVTPAGAATPVYDVKFDSAALDGEMYYDVILPDGYTNNHRYPVLYLLPGRNMRYTTWRANSDLLNQMTNRPFILVIPDTDNAWYMGSWAVYIARDLCAHVEARWRAQNVRGIAGISMGGYGAFYVAGRSTALGGRPYHSLSSMSGAFIEPELSFILDGVVVATSNVLAKALADKPFPILLDCGNEDQFSYWLGDYDLADRNDRMFGALLDRGRILWTNLFYYRPPGDHDWTCWNSNMPVHLAFHDGIFANYPFVSITSHLEYATTVVSSEIVRVAGVAYAGAGISHLAWQSTAKSFKASGPAVGTDTWYADVSNRIGRNTITITAWATSGMSNWSRAYLFRRNMTFRIRSVTVTRKQVMVRASDLTNGDVNALTNGVSGFGSFQLDGFAKTMTNAWKRSGRSMARYREKTTNWTVSVAINGDATKDTALLVFKPAKGQMPTNFFEVIRVSNSIPLVIEFGAHRVETNVQLNAKGRYRYTGPWF